MTDIKTVLVLGAGVMGKGIAQHLACQGLKVKVFSRTEKTLTKCSGQIRESLNALVAQGRMNEDRKDRVLSRLSSTMDISAAAPVHDLVIETISEDLDLKKTVFAQLDDVCPAETILATNTSSFDIDAIANAATRHPDRVVGMHWFHPPPITPGIEIIGGAMTSPETINRIIDFSRAIGKIPTRCANAPGFVANRIQMAMAAEALKIVAEGLATPQEVDEVVRSSFGFRLGAFGPFEIIDMAGTDTYLSIMRYMHKKLGWDIRQVEKLLTSLVDQNKLGLKNGAGFYEYDEDREKQILEWRDSFLSRRLDVFEAEVQERNG